MTRKYSSISVEQLLDAPMGAADTTLTLDNSAAVTALLGGVSLAAGNVDQFTIVVDPDTASEEIIFVRGTSGNQLTGLQRGQAGTSGTTHTAGATVKHVLTSNDLDFYTAGVATANAAVTATSTTTLTNKTIALGSNTVSGTTAQFNTALTDGDFATLAGTETLTNKTITSPAISGATLTTSTLTSPTVDDPKLNLSVNAQTGTTYTFVLADNGKLVTASNASAQTYSIPTNASVAFPTGTQINVLQIGTGQVTINAVTSGTTTVTSTGATAAAPKLRAQYSAATCIKTGTDTWTVVGDIA
jgi:hypothetical protein